MMKRITLKKVFIIGAVMAFLITYTYCNSITILYGAIELSLAAFCFWKMITLARFIDRNVIRCCTIVIVFAFFMGLISGNLKSTTLLSISICLPLAISTVDVISYNESRDISIAFLFCFCFMLLQKRMGIFGEISAMGNGMNSNTFGFFCFLYISAGFAAFRSEKNLIKKILIGSMVLYSGYLGMMSGSRNVIVVTAICIILSIVPDYFFRSKVIFRIMYGVVLLYVIFASTYIENIFANNNGLAKIIIDFTARFSNKAWEMSSRAEYLIRVQNILSQDNIVQKIIGTGILRFHCHNLFLQLRSAYGYLGAGLLFVVYIRVFEMAHDLIFWNKDRITLGLTIALMGIFLLNGADVFVAGLEACTVIPQVIMGVIMSRYRLAFSNSEY